MAGKPLSLLATFKAVAWSFFGVRKSADHDSDMANLNPLHVIIVGVFLCFVFVLSLLAVVKYIVL